MGTLIPTGATVFAGSFLFVNVSSNSFYFFAVKREQANKNSEIRHVVISKSRGIRGIIS